MARKGSGKVEMAGVRAHRINGNIDGKVNLIFSKTNRMRRVRKNLEELLAQVVFGLSLESGSNTQT